MPQATPTVPVHTRVGTTRSTAANDALADVRPGRFTGAAVIVP